MQLLHFKKLDLVIPIFLLGMTGGSGLAQVGDPGPSNLSVCGKEPTRVTLPAQVDVKELAQRLHGTWVLEPRTIQGVIIDTDSQFYFDIEQTTDTSASGVALLIDRGNLSTLDPLKFCPECLADATLGALWSVTVRKNTNEKPSIVLTMSGEYRGSYGDFRKGVTGKEEATFFKQGASYYSGHLTSPTGFPENPSDVWDRIELSENVLTYVSCRSRFIDRYVKKSDSTPELEGRSLRAAWKKVKNDGSLLNPPHVERPIDGRR